MKKNLLISALWVLIAASAFSQGFKITREGNDLTNGHANILFDKNDSVSIGTGGDFAGFGITNLGTGSKNVKIRKEESGIQPGTSSFFCWAACYSTSTNETPDPLAVAAGATSNSLILDFNSAGVFGESIIKYTVFDAAHPSDTAVFYVHYNAGFTGINNLKNSAPTHFTSVFPNPASSNVTVNYNAPQGQSYIEVRNMLGQVKQSINLSAASKNTTFSVEDYSAGIYFLTLKVNGNTTDTKKLVVR